LIGLVLDSQLIESFLEVHYLDVAARAFVSNRNFVSGRHAKYHRIDEEFSELHEDFEADYLFKAAQKEVGVFLRQLGPSESKAFSHAVELRPYLTDDILDRHAH